MEKIQWLVGLLKQICHIILESYDFKMYCKYMEKILLYFYSVFSTNQV